MAEKIKIFNEKGKISKQIVDIAFDKAITNRFNTLSDYLIDANLKVNPKELALLTDRVEKNVYKQLFYYSHLMYHIMESSNDWGEPGEQQVKIAFCRNLLKVDSKRTLSQDDALAFMEKVEKNLKELDIRDILPITAKSQLKNYMFTILGRQIPAFKSQEIDRVQRFCGSKRFLHGGQFGADHEFILGEGKKTHKQGYDIYYVTKEVLRTPNNVMSMAAIIGNRNIYIRMECLKTIFAQKWIQMFDYNEMEKEQIRTNDYWNVAEGIKQKVLHYYGVKSQDSLEKLEKTFLGDMAETILYHELGHGIIQHDTLPLELGAIGEATKLYGENIYTSILEFLADFAPPQDDIVGPIHNMIRISKKDRNRAIRMYFMYLSDTWFFNTEDKYMYTYSDMMALILLRYISPDGDVNFEQLEQDMQFRDDRMKEKQLTVFERIYELFVWDANEIKNIIEHATYSVVDQKLDYKKVRSLLVDQFKKNDGFVHEDTYEFLVPFWTNMIGYIQQISDSKKQLEDFVNNQERKILMKMLILSCGRKKAEAYNYDHRKFIVDQMKALGITAKPPTLTS
ncbi:hypothetical protein HOH87_07940 [bacterium]|jgi:hypothetical protein|nr:hypothetical protein [bacterium]